MTALSVVTGFDCRLISLCSWLARVYSPCDYILSSLSLPIDVRLLPGHVEPRLHVRQYDI